jgi:hypothetical protein
LQKGGPVQIQVQKDNTQVTPLTLLASSLCFLKPEFQAKRYDISLSW